MTRSRNGRLAAFAVALGIIASPIGSQADPIEPVTAAVEEDTTGLTMDLPELGRDDLGYGPIDDVFRRVNKIEALTVKQKNYEPVRDPARAAWDELSNGDTQIDRVLAAIANAMEAAQTVTPDREDAAEWFETLDGLARAAGRIASDQIALAESTGVDPTQTSPAAEDVELGLAMLDTGDYPGGAKKFVEGFNKIKGTAKLSTDKLFTNIKAKMENRAVGYQFTIVDNGTVVREWAQGGARLEHDKPEADQTTSRDQMVASVSKTVTAIAIHRLLKANGNLDPRTTKIAPYLPVYWQKGSGVADLTFADVMAHRSGLNGNGKNYLATWKSTRGYIKGGVTIEADPDVPGKRKYNYLNANYLLLGAAIGKLWEPTREAFQTIEAFGPLMDSFYASAASDVYTAYVTNHVLEPAGIEVGTCNDQPNPTLYYGYPNSLGNGATFTLTDIRCAYGGWRLSTTDLARFLSHVRHDNDFLASNYRALMNAESLGWFPPSFGSSQGQHGIYHGHGGDLWNEPDSPFMPLQGLDACIMSFPGKVQVALLINSHGAYPNYQCSMLRDAYDTAFVKA